MAGGIAFRDFRVCGCVASSLPVVEKVMLMRGLISESIDIYQGGYNAGGVAASSGTHDLGGCIDVGQDSPAQIQVWRECGWAMQARTRAQGFTPHAHGWPMGCPHGSAGQKAQAGDWNVRDAGLVGGEQVKGMWPVPHWRTAMLQKEKEVSAFADEIVDRVTKRVLEAIADIPRRVWGVDGVIDNQFTGNTANKDVAGGSALITIDNKVDKVLAAVRQPAPTLPKEPTT